MPKNNETKSFNQPDVMISAIAFAEWIEWGKYERFKGQENLWYDKKSTYTNPIPIKTTEDLWNEFVEIFSNKDSNYFYGTI